MQFNPQILAMSEQLIFSLAWCVVLLVITGLAIWKYNTVGNVVQLWAAMGTITGAMGGYFFTRQQVKEQQAQTELYRAAYQEGEKLRVNAGKQVWAVATKLQPDAASPEIIQAFQQLARDLLIKVPVARIETPTPSLQPTASPIDTEFHDMLFRGSPKPRPSVQPTASPVDRAYRDMLFKGSPKPRP